MVWRRGRLASPSRVTQELNKRCVAKLMSGLERSDRNEDLPVA
jgi:hypothetical protein